MATQILLIEDEIQIRENVATLLSLKGYEVSTAPDGREGISQAMVSPPDLILCDIMMPEMDGYQVLDTIRNNRSLATVPFIFLTARTEEIDVRRGMVSGADDYLTKPFTLDSLLRTIESRLQREALREAGLQARLEELRRSLTSVSTHEYNTPLSGILGFTSLLLDHYQEFNEEDTLSMLSMIKASALRLKRSLDNLRFIEELQQINPTDSSFEFFTNGISRIDADVVKQQIAKVRERKDEEIDCQIEVVSAVVDCSETSVRIILDELIDNACKFSKGARSIRISGWPEGINYHLSISNVGQLFKAEDIARIAPYTQFDRKIYEQQGSGLGLSIVKKLLDFKKSTLTIQSTPEGETSVTIIFQQVLN
ncbi:phospho-acceptor domain-containing protein [Larkinella arboricola]|uniref:histidine kinase n=1 Tax=Larkinella arboricola TaxID=643671 RepID=A0A327X5D5_LARAB|nr:response regulator [Larkinella arboricola]RAK00564.1 phospho-acceptor domain-containing protein [Larkinella arboricola]